MLTRKTDIILLATTAALAVSAFLFPVLLQGSGFFFLLMIVLLGIPHGALDHIFYFQNNESHNSIRFYVIYLGLFAITGLLWFIAPTISFIAFLFISAYHFGQSQLFYMKGPEWLKHLLFMSWGIFLLSMIVYTNLEECLAIFASMEWLNQEILSMEAIWSVSTIAGLIITSLGLIYAGLRKWIPIKRLMIEIGLLIILTFLALVSNAVFTFALYFGLWHSLRSLIIEYEALPSKSESAPVSSFFKLIFPFSILAVGILAAAYFILPSYLEGISPYMIFIIIISMLTVPHLFVMYDLYKKYA